MIDAVTALDSPKNDEFVVGKTDRCVVWEVNEDLDVNKMEIVGTFHIGLSL